MRKLFWKSGASEGPFLHAAMLIFLFSGIVCHAQNCTLTPAQENQTFQFTNFSPTAWPIGQSTTVTLTGSWTTRLLRWVATRTLSRCKACCGGGNGVRDPNVTFSNIVESLSPLQTRSQRRFRRGFVCRGAIFGRMRILTGAIVPNYSEISGDIYLCHTPCRLYPPCLQALGSQDKPTT